MNINSCMILKYPKNSLKNLKKNHKCLSKKNSKSIKKDTTNDKWFCQMKKPQFVQ